MGAHHPERLEPIQWFRGIAVLAVVLLHSLSSVLAGYPGALAPWIATLAQLGNIGASGVDLFFVISGFVMTHSLRASSFPGARIFLLRRMQRIVPLFILASALFLLAYPGPIAIQSMLMSVTILPLFDGAGYHPPALYVGWTLGFEFAFYALVALAVRARHAAATLFALTIGCGLAGLIFSAGWAPLRLLFNPMQFEFALGVAMWMAWRADRIARWAPALAILGVAGLTVSAIGVPGLYISTHYDAAVAGASGLPRTLFWGLPWALILAASLSEKRSGAVAGVLRDVGDASYAIYLVHPIVIILLDRAAPAQSAVPHFLVAVVGSVAAGYLLHRLVERRLLAGRLFGNGRERVAQTALNA